MVDRTGGSVEERIAVERESSGAQIRTPLNEQRKTIIAEYCEKVSHHEFLAAQAEQDRRRLQEELLRQQQDFREVHRQDLIKMKELQKFQSSTFDEFTKQKFIEDQKIIMELSGRLQELQNEVNCMNDSKDFQDAEVTATRAENTDTLRKSVGIRSMEGQKSLSVCCVKKTSWTVLDTELHVIPQRFTEWRMER